ncbi:MAG: coproporphyrinogen dehydrogenase HemZ [Lachnospiraceae bacterium]|nr:coproporphyrinogen dehydrogenase HemZ [Lachnospiraceae bacterium]
MKKNNIDLEITGLDFRQDVEPLIKEFFPGFFNDFDVRISIMAFDTSFDVTVERARSYNDDLSHCKEVSEGNDECDKTAAVSEQVEFTSNEDAKIRHRDYRNQLLRALYRVLKKFTGKELPWGILTGVRPTKLLFERIERGEGKPLQFMEEKYYCSREKASLAARIVAVEYQILDPIDHKNGYSLYVGIPFCPSICNYCTFGSHPIGKFSELVEPYIEALGKEIRAVSSIKPGKLQTVYIGGGTPTSLSAEQLGRIIRCVKENFDMSRVAEFTVEAGRPDSITEEKLIMLKEEEISRISINPQTFSQKTLDIIGREHTPEQVINTFMTARSLGFDNINMDLIAGLTGEDEKDFAHTLDCVKMLDPDSLTIHTLAHKRAARITTNPELYEQYAAGKDKLEGLKNYQTTELALTAESDRKIDDSDQTAAARTEGSIKDGTVVGMLKSAERFTKENGYVPYYMYRQKNMTDNLENVGYSKPGKECIYNILIMEEVQPILAVGAGASSKFPCTSGEKRFGRVENVKNVREYINRIDEMIERKKNAFS